MPVVVVNTNRTYPAFANALYERYGHSKWDPIDQRDSALVRLMDLTAGNWPAMSAANAQTITEGTLLVGTFQNRVTSTWLIRSVRSVPAQTPKVAFQITPADAYTHLIGTIQPGGPWKRGEARGIRLLTATPEASESGRYAWLDAVATFARDVAEGSDLSDYDQPPALFSPYVDTNWATPDATDGISTYYYRKERVLTVVVPPGVSVMVRTEDRPRGQAKTLPPEISATLGHRTDSDDLDPTDQD